MKTRREFIRISALGAGGMAVAGSALSLTRAADFFSPEELSDSEIEKLTRIPTYCEVCFWKCAGWIYKDDNGKIWKVVGNDEDQHCNGRFCPRGTGGIGMYYDKDRLKTPMIRTDEK